MTSITPQQCRAARGLLGWSQNDLAKKAKMGRATIADYEVGTIKPWPHTLAKIINAFEMAGIRFIDPIEGVTGPGVALKWGVELPESPHCNGTKDPTEGSESLKSLSWEDDLEEACEEHTPEMLELRDYWRERPEQWAAFHESSRQVILGLMGLRRL